MICSSCGFESKQATHCDLCGEPFAKKTEAAKTAPAKKPAEKPVPIPPEVMQKLLEAGARREPPRPEGPVDIPPEFKHLDDGGRIAEIPPEARKLAWVMLAVVMAWIVGMTVWMFTHQGTIAANLK